MRVKMIATVEDANGWPTDLKKEDKWARPFQVALEVKGDVTYRVDRLLAGETYTLDEPQASNLIDLDLAEKA